MTATNELIVRNQKFQSGFSFSEMPILPRLRTVILTCADARVDPAHVLGVDLGDAVVIRNNGGRVTGEALTEIATLAFMVSRLTGNPKAGFELFIMQHTQCGAERFADPAFQQAIGTELGIDVTGSAITDHDASLRADIERLRSSEIVPRQVVVSGWLYDVSTGAVREVVPAGRLG